eukprot:6209643-Pleurochrysis_carterae.AAC.1
MSLHCNGHLQQCAIRPLLALHLVWTISPSPIVRDSACIQLEAELFFVTKQTVHDFWKKVGLRLTLTVSDQMGSIPGVQLDLTLAVEVLAIGAEML